MPVITYKHTDGRTGKAVVATESMAAWISSREARGARIEHVEFGPGERASIVLATNTGNPAGELALMRTDLGMARVIEDLFEALKAKGVLADADLPRESLEKLTERELLREAVR